MKGKSKHCPTRAHTYHCIRSNLWSALHELYPQQFAKARLDEHSSDADIRRRATTRLAIIKRPTQGKLKTSLWKRLGEQAEATGAISLRARMNTIR